MSDECQPFAVNISAGILSVEIGSDSIPDVGDVGDLPELTESELLTVDLQAGVFGVDLSQYAASSDSLLQIELCRPKQAIRYLTYRGEPVLYKGEPVYAFVEV